MDERQLMDIAVRHDLVLRLLHRPGDYVHEGRALLEAVSARFLGDEATERLRECYSIGTRRTPRHDLDFLVDQLVEIAGRALSTGVNDPTTAATCLDWLGAGASEMARRRLPSPLRMDEQGSLRAIARGEDFEGFVDRAFGALRQYSARDRNAAIHLLRTLAQVTLDCRATNQRDCIRSEADRLVEQAQAALDTVAFEEVRRCRVALSFFAPEAPAAEPRTGG